MHNTGTKKHPGSQCGAGDDPNYSEYANECKS